MGKEPLMKIIKYMTAIVAVSWLAGSLSVYPAQKAYRLNEKEMKNLLQRIEERADQFRGSLKDALDKGRFDDSKTEDKVNHLVKEFEAATDRLKDHFDKNESAAGDVEEVLKRAANIDGFMTGHPLTARAQSDWMSLRGNLDELARSYNVSWDWSGLTNHPHRINDRRVKALLERIEEAADRFRGSLKEALDKTRFDDTKAEDNINHFIKNFEQATDRLKDRFDKNQSAASDAEEVLTRAADIDRFMLRHSLKARAQEDWRRLRANLDELAQAYGVSWRWS
jgi:cytochrome c556